MKQYKLLDGNTIDVVGFGTYKIKGIDGVAALISAYQCGYRLFDSAYNYENEGTLGRAIRDSHTDRRTWKITSKLPGRYHHYEDALRTIEESLYRLGVDYIDYYLIHWPNPKQGHYVEAWKALIEAQKRGYVKTIGVCNFTPVQIERLIEETGVTPAINQIECHPYFNQKALIEYHQSKGIISEAWSPLGRASAMLQDSSLMTLAQKYGKTVTQIVLRWHLQCHTLAIPKSAHAERQKENISLFDFELSESDMKMINALSREDGRIQNQDPDEYEEF